MEEDPSVSSLAGVEQPQNHLSSAKIVEEFTQLLEKSQKLFSGLRDLPPTGGYKQWHPYFQRTFEVYTKLWKFQQQHRQVLESKEGYGLKRWEIGEIASKIGQLYYHYYLRTSESNYLSESYVFYDAIHMRNYFGDVFTGRNQQLVIKKLRYYARFIVVCLLLNKKTMVKTLTENLSEAVYTYSKLFRPADAGEWQIVLQEIAAFTEADTKLLPIEPENFKGRLSITHAFENEKSRLRVQEAILVGNRHEQVKFSELTLDIYRMLQVLEREPPGPNSTQEEREVFEKDISRRPNPRKYLLYRTNFSQLMTFLATSYKELADNTAILLYLSADGFLPARSMHFGSSGNNSNAGANQGLEQMDLLTTSSLGKGGVFMGSRKGDEGGDGLAEQNCFYPHDLFPFLRRPFFLIVDSQNSTAFDSIPRLYRQPFVCLMSPTDYPPSLKDCKEVGNIFTLFLYSPLLAFSFVCMSRQLSRDDWSGCSQELLEIEYHIDQSIRHSDAMDRSIQRFFEDDFTAQLIVRFVFCSATLRLFSQFSSRKNLPTMSPALPPGVLQNQKLESMIVALANRLGARATFKDPH